MNWVWLILGAIAIFYVGIFVGFYVQKWLLYRSGFDGRILVIKDDGKILYSLELDDDPEEIQYKSELILKVKPLEEGILGRS